MLCLSSTPLPLVSKTWWGRVNKENVGGPTGTTAKAQHPDSLSPETRNSLGAELTLTGNHQILRFQSEQFAPNTEETNQESFFPPPWRASRGKKMEEHQQPFSKDAFGTRE